MSHPEKSNASRSRLLNSRFGRIGMGRLSVVEFLVALVLLLFTAPFLEYFPDGDLVESGLMTLVMVAAVLAVGHRGRLLVWAIALVTPALLGKWINHFRPDLISPKVFLLSALVFLVFVVVQFMRFILRAPRVNAEVMCAGISVYLLLGMLWAFAYTLVARLIPDAFALNGTPIAGPPLHGFGAFYFSYITLTTVGYGDIVPVVPAARMLAATEAMTGTLFVAILISRLVALYSSQSSAAPENETGPK